MKKIILLVIGFVGGFMMTDANAILPRLSTLPKNVLSKKTYSTGRVIQKGTDISQKLNNNEKVQALEDENRRLHNKNSSLHSLLVQMHKELRELIEALGSSRKSSNVKE